MFWHCFEVHIAFVCSTASKFLASETSFVSFAVTYPNNTCRRQSILRILQAWSRVRIVSVLPLIFKSVSRFLTPEQSQFLFYHCLGLSREYIKREECPPYLWELIWSLFRNCSNLGFIFVLCIPCHSQLHRNKDAITVIYGVYRESAASSGVVLKLVSPLLVSQCSSQHTSRKVNPHPLPLGTKHHQRSIPSRQHVNASFKVQGSTQNIYASIALIWVSSRVNLLRFVQAWYANKSNLTYFLS